jgi:hypothetical protein
MITSDNKNKIFTHTLDAKLAYHNPIDKPEKGAAAFCP